jgi:hypothetical protein
MSYHFLRTVVLIVVVLLAAPVLDTPALSSHTFAFVGQLR